MSSRLPATLIGGYLGAGKTTLVNALLRGADGRRLAVLVNDFGELPIDADLIEAREGNLLSISGGCICCSFGSDLIAAIMELRAADRPIDHLLIETSGVALPGTIAQSLQLIPDIDVNGIVVLADAESVRDRAADRYMGDTVLAQLAAADIIVLNKVDLISPEQISATTAWLKQTATRARVLPAQRANLPPELILTRQDEQTKGRFFASGHDTAQLATVGFEIDGNGDPEALAQALADASLHLLRVKGIVRDRHGALVAVHVMGRRASVEPAPRAVQSPGRLVCIGVAHEIDAKAVADAIAARPPYSAKLA
ncbi:MAG: GTP-binding protein [Bradyrhizobium sp.]|nr:GTP-binding protein [Bradyrhizobium sp.]